MSRRRKKKAKQKAKRKRKEKKMGDGKKRRFKAPVEPAPAEPVNQIVQGPGAAKPDPRTMCPIKSGPVVMGVQKTQLIAGVQGADVNVMIMAAPCDGPAGDCRFWDQYNEVCMIEAIYAMLDFDLEKRYPEEGEEAHDGEGEVEAQGEETPAEEVKDEGGTD